ncbi:MAG: thermonuclease family protein [Geminicoccaceae bacterium]
MSGIDAQTAICLLIRSVLVTIFAVPALAIDPIEGEARVLRADVLAIGGARITLKGILPPEDAEICGETSCVDAAKAWLAELVAGHQTTCTRDKRLQHGLYSGICLLDNGQDLAAELLRAGWARPGNNRISEQAPDKNSRPLVVQLLGDQ